MEAVVGLMLILIQSSYGAVTSCDGRQDGAQCYGALGGTVDIRLMNNTSKIYRFTCKHGDTVTPVWRRNRSVPNIKNRAVFIPTNGTFRLHNLSRTDSGEYKLFTYDSQGIFTGKRTLQLSVQSPVSSVQLVPQCLSQGQMEVSCSSEGGDSPQYSWTLDGHTLTDSELLSGNNETNIIVLRPTVSGRLICSVRNHVSNLSKELQLDQPVASDCGFIFINCSSNGTHMSEWVFAANNTLCVEPTTGPHSTVERWRVIVGVLSALVFLVAVSASVICGRRKQTNTAEEDDRELTYSDVRVVQQRRRRVEQVEEQGVEYGQIKFSKPSEAVADDSAHTNVQKGRTTIEPL